MEKVRQEERIEYLKSARKTLEKFKREREERRRAMTEKTPFSEALKAARKEAGLTQQRLADEAKISKRAIEEWETDRRTPPAYVQHLVLDWIRSRTPLTKRRMIETVEELLDRFLREAEDVTDHTREEVYILLRSITDTLEENEDE